MTATPTTTNEVQFGLTLPNKMVLKGLGSLHDIIELGVEAENTGLFRSLWVGDSIIAKRRPESIVLLSALAARTKRVRLGVGCMASFTLRHPVLLASQWGTLDTLAGPGRMILAACIGGRLAGGDWEIEDRAFGIESRQRLARMVEGIEALKALWTQETATFEGRFHKFYDVTMEPRPVTKPHPAIWIAANPKPQSGDPEVVRRSTQRIARHADGWMTTRLTTTEFKERWELILDALPAVGKDPATYDNTLYFNVNINEDREQAFNTAKHFLDTYYERDWPVEAVRIWGAYGSPQEVIETIAAFAEVGAKEITIRLCDWDQKGQFERLVSEVLPAFTKGGGA